MSRLKRVLAVLAALLAASSMLVSSQPGAAGQGLDGLRIGVVGGFDNLNPFIASGAASLSVIDKVYEPLIHIDGMGRVAPALAEASRSGGSTWVFRIRPGAAWHDGEPVKAEDVAFTLSTITSGEGLDRHGLRRLLSGIRVVNSSSVELVFSGPALDALRVLSRIYIAPLHAFSGVDPASYGNPNPIGSGPYRLSGFVSRVEARLERVGGERGPSELRVVAFGEGKDAALALRKGDVWLIDGFPFAEGDLGVLMGPGVSVIRGVGERAMLIFFNLEGRLTSSRGFRAAIHRALDLEELVRRADPLAEPLSFSLTSLKHGELLGSLPRPLHRADPEGAGLALDELGFKMGPDGLRTTSGGEPLSLRIVHSDSAPARIVAGEVASMLGQLGIGSSLRPVNASEATRGALGDYDMAILEVPYPGEIHALYAGLLSRGGPYNFAGYSGGAVEEALARLAGARDVDEALPVVGSISSLIAEELPFIPLYAEPVFSAYRGDRLGVVDVLDPASTRSIMGVRLLGTGGGAVTVTSTVTLLSTEVLVRNETVTVTVSGSPPPAAPEASLALLMAIAIFGGIVVAGIFYYAYRPRRPA